ncbi:MAG TPA: hypothetical protein VFJ85_09670 [Acidimicrobiales bacterium]|nr:hypothetical protein [Acidimicrobiales bacterium]
MVAALFAAGLLLSACRLSVATRTSVGTPTTTAAASAFTLPPPSTGFAGAPATDFVGSCRHLLDGVATAAPLAADPVALVTSDRLAPIPGAAARSVFMTRPLARPEDYLAESTVEHPDVRLAALRRDGFQNGVMVDFNIGSQAASAYVLRFAGPAEAVDYMRVHVDDVCPIALSADRLDGLPGISYLRDDHAARAIFVAGNTEVNLELCPCFDAETAATVRGWAAAVAAQLASGR